MHWILAFFLSSICLILFYTKTGSWFLDIPNQRSMHQTPVKRGGGMVFSSVFLISFFSYFVKNKFDLSTFLFISLGVLFFLLLGFADDLWNLSFKWKAPLELLFLGGLFYYFGFFQEIQIFQVTIPKSLSFVLLILYTFFTINLCNFMDGLDLYLGVSFLIFLVNLYASDLKISTTYFHALLIFVVCVIPFYYFNFPNAKMFMGDSGSLPLGFMISIFPLFLEGKFQGELSLAPIMLPMFWVDGVYTILIRLKKRQNIFLAHREHLYQKIQIQFFTKMQTIFTFLYFNFLPSFLFVIHSFGIIKNFWVIYGIIFFICHFVYFYLYYLVRKTLHKHS